jgi:hypothetical protein
LLLSEEEGKKRPPLRRFLQHATDFVVQFSAFPARRTDTVCPAVAEFRECARAVFRAHFIAKRLLLGFTGIKQ